MLTTAKSITGRKEGNSALKSQKKSTRIQGKLKGKSVILLKEKETLTYHQHDRFMQNFEILKTSQTKPEHKRKE